MTEARKVANHMENYKERAFEYEEKVRPYLDQIRDHIDHLEMEVDDEIWPLPKYRELLFYQIKMSTRLHESSHFCAIFL